MKGCEYRFLADLMPAGAMTSRTDRAASIVEALSALLRSEAAGVGEELQRLQALVRSFGEGAGDRRPAMLLRRLAALERRLERAHALAVDDLLAKLGSALAETSPSPFARLRVMLAPLLSLESVTLGTFCERLLDLAISAVQAQRGFVLLFEPESGAAEVVCARRFDSTDLSREEYLFSRTVLGDVLGDGRPLLVDDAAGDERYSGESSVQRLQLRSVVAAPMRLSARIVGALYLEDCTRPCAFSAADLEVVQLAGDIAGFTLYNAGALPATMEPHRRSYLGESSRTWEIVGRDQRIGALLDTIAQVADSPATVLIEGESGTGKELVARALHLASSRREHPFVTINCAAIPETLLESELFGHERGAFTGATESFPGRIARAHGGTLFLDEIDELPLPLQAKLLRFLQSGEIDRVGGRAAVRIETRVVAATSRDLRERVAAGTFHKALYYRINVVPLVVPPLRERRDDIPLLIEHFLSRYCAGYRKLVRLDRGVVERLRGLDFPGNVRELENLVHRLVALARGEVVHVFDLPAEYQAPEKPRTPVGKCPLERVLHVPARTLGELQDLRNAVRAELDVQERTLVERAVHDADGNVSEAASRLGLHRVSLHKILRRTRPPE